MTGHLGLVLTVSHPPFDDLSRGEVVSHQHQRLAGHRLGTSFWKYPF
jgi:hypothetical protein